MSYFNSLEQSIKYIEDHLKEDIDLSAVAKEAGYSLYHFQRLFKSAVGDSIKEYITKRRMTEAAKELTYSEQSIIDIAFKYGYQSREAFSRAFERVYGKTPSEVKRGGLLYFIREPMTFDYMMFEYKKRKEGIQPTIRKLNERFVVGVKETFKADGSNLKNIPLLWNQWHQEQIWKRITNRKYDDECMGICIHSDGELFDYMIGHEVDQLNQIPNDLEVHCLPTSLYAVFKTIGPITESVQKTWDYIYSTWLIESDYEHAGYDDIEYYYYHQGELVADLYVPIK